MSERAQRRALLGRLAGLGWFARHGEVAATQALAMLLEEPQLREALLRHLNQIAGTDVGAVRSFPPEVVHTDLARPDLEGQDQAGRPLVVVEAKFGAQLTARQLLAYRTDQRARLDARDGVLIVLVPSYRIPEAQALITAVEDQMDGTPAASIALAADTWENWLEILDSGADELPVDDRSAVLSDLGQLRSLCAAMRALDVPPLGVTATGRELDERKGDLHRLVKEVTSRYPAPSGRLLPMQEEGAVGFRFRYIPGGLIDVNCYCAVGVAAALAADDETPFWLRYHRKTSSFQTVSDRIMASRFATDARGNEGHLWLPLRVSDDRSGAAVMEELVEKIEEIRAVAAGSDAPDDRVD